MKSAIYWFTNDLRVMDNPLLQQALKDANQLVAVYVVNPSWVKPYRYQMASMSYGRWHFLKQSLEDLRLSLAAKGVELIVLYDEPQNALNSLINELKPEGFYCANQVGFDEQACLDNIKTANPMVKFKTEWVDTLFSSAQIEQFGGISGSFSDFRKRLESSLDLNETLVVEQQSYSNSNVIHAFYLSGIKSEDLDCLGLLFKRRASGKPSELFTGGESAAVQHLQDYFASGAPSCYKQTRNDLDGFSRSTKMSPWLAVGCLSPRRIWTEKAIYEHQHGANDSTYWIGFELLWREYFHWLALKQGAKLFRFKGLAKNPPLTTFHSERFKKWCQGNTPYPLVNACMRQLNASGYMSNRGRQIVASCLVNELALDWRYGAAYFEQQLLDYDVASNWGNWQYIAGVGVDPRGGRHFNLDKQTVLYDPDYVFIDKWQGRRDLVPLDSVDMVDWPLEA